MPLTRRRSTRLRQAGHPVVRIMLDSAEHIGQEFFRFEIATRGRRRAARHQSVRSARRRGEQGENPRADGGVREVGQPCRRRRRCSRDQIVDLYTDATNAEALRQAGATAASDSWLKAHFARIRPGDYVAVLAYVARNEAHIGMLQKLRLALRDRGRVATCLGFGPRFLHSTGQAYKGGPDSGVFLQITGGRCRGFGDPRTSRELRRRKGRAGAWRLRRAWSSAGGARCACISRAMWRPALRACSMPRSTRADVTERARCRSA